MLTITQSKDYGVNKVHYGLCENGEKLHGEEMQRQRSRKIVVKIVCVFLFFFLSTPLNLVYSIDVLTITFMQAMMKMESFYVENSGLSL